MTQKNINQLATARSAEANLSMPNLVNNKATQIMSETFKDIETGEEVSKSTTYYVESENKLVEVYQTSKETTNLINPFEIGFTEPIKYSDYFKIEEGDNLVRVLTPAIFGVEWWTEEVDKESGKIKKRPNRLPLGLALSECPVLDWSYFNACYVWNYKANKVQIMTTTKRGIINGLKNLINKPKWGDLEDYDINITKTLKNPNDPKSAEYSVTPEPKGFLEGHIVSKWEESNLSYQSLGLLFEGLDPFEETRQAKLNNIASMVVNQDINSISGINQTLNA